MYLIPTIDEYSEQEIKRSWRSQEDDQETQREVIETIQMLRQNNGKIPQKCSHRYTARGLEHMKSTKAMDERKERKLRLFDAVLDEQDRQFDADIDDQDCIAMIASDCSKTSIGLAITLAVKDAAAAAFESNFKLEPVDSTTKAVKYDASFMAPQILYQQ